MQIIFFGDNLHGKSKPIFWEKWQKKKKKKKKKFNVTCSCMLSVNLGPAE